MEMIKFVFLFTMMGITIAYFTVGLAFCLKAVKEDEDTQYFADK